MNHLTVTPQNMKGRGKQKQNNAPEPDTCPVCGQEYALKTVFSSGTHWKDVYQGTAYDFFTRYRRRCTANTDVENEDRVIGRDEVVLYFHGDKKMRAQI